MWRQTTMGSRLSGNLHPACRATCRRSLRCAAWETPVVTTRSAAEPDSGSVAPVGFRLGRRTVRCGATACGTPVLGDRRGAPPETVDQGVTGFLVDEIDSARAKLGRCQQSPSIDDAPLVIALCAVGCMLYPRNTSAAEGRRSSAACGHPASGEPCHARPPPLPDTIGRRIFAPRRNGGTAAYN